jgi:hypothetical protein
MDIFAWKPVDMPGVPRELIEHELHLDQKAKPAKQRLCHFIKEVYHLDWLTNLVLVHKKDKD